MKSGSGPWPVPLFSWAMSTVFPLSNRVEVPHAFLRESPPGPGARGPAAGRLR